MVATINWLPFILLFTLLGAFGAFFFKRASSHGLQWSRHLMFSLLFGGVCYGSGALLNIYVLKKVDYTVVFPLTSITYVWTFLIAVLFLKERMTLRKLIGVVCIMLGTILIM